MFPPYVPMATLIARYFRNRRRWPNLTPVLAWNLARRFK